MSSNKFRLEDDHGNAYITGALNVADPTELLVGEIRSKNKNQGHGTRLLRALEELGKSRGAKRFRAVLGKFEDTDINALRRFYEENGYELLEQDDMVVAVKKAL